MENKKFYYRFFILAGMCLFLFFAGLFSYIQLNDKETELLLGIDLFSNNMKTDKWFNSIDFTIPPLNTIYVNNEYIPDGHISEEYYYIQLNNSETVSNANWIIPNSRTSEFTLQNNAGRNIGRSGELLMYNQVENSMWKIKLFVDGNLTNKKGNLFLTKENTSDFVPFSDYASENNTGKLRAGPTEGGDPQKVPIGDGGTFLVVLCTLYYILQKLKKQIKSV